MYNSIQKLSLEKLKQLAPGMFCWGESSDSSEGINMTGAGSGKLLRWVAVRGDYWDWTIYCHWASNNYSYIAAYGDKVTDERTIKRLVDCTDEAFEMYRY